MSAGPRDRLVSRASYGLHSHAPQYTRELPWRTVGDRDGSAVEQPLRACLKLWSNACLLSAAQSCFTVVEHRTTPPSSWLYHSVGWAERRSTARTEIMGTPIPQGVSILAEVRGAMSPSPKWTSQEWVSPRFNDIMPGIMLPACQGRHTPAFSSVNHFIGKVLESRSRSRSVFFFAFIYSWD
jgi:hypothetical protein